MSTHFCRAAGKFVLLAQGFSPPTPLILVIHFMLFLR